MVSLDMFIDSDYQRRILCASFITSVMQYNPRKPTYMNRHDRTAVDISGAIISADLHLVVSTG